MFIHYFKVGKENVQSALSLIEYDRYFEPVMKFVFGHTLVCRDLNVAKQVSYVYLYIYMFIYTTRVFI